MDSNTSEIRGVSDVDNHPDDSESNSSCSSDEDDSVVSSNPSATLHPYQCPCGRTYANIRSFNKHNKKCTEEKSAPLYPRKCDVCPAVLENKVQFFRHKNNCSAVLESSKKGEKARITYPRKCEICHNDFGSKQAFSRHKTQKQCTPDFKKTPCSPCIHEGCTRTFYHRTKMIQHLIIDHMKEFKITHHSFTSKAKFEAWKDTVEQESYTCFTAPCGATGKDDPDSKKYHYYTCVFDAHDRIRKTVPKNKWKWEKGCIPTEMLCPARMLVTETENEQMEVKFIETHNHPTSYQLSTLHRVPLSTRHFIRTCLMTGMKADKIQELLRGDVGNLGNRDSDTKPKKDYFISIQYINHIKGRIKAEGRLHKNDHTSVDMHVRNMMHIGRFKVEGVINTGYDGFDDGHFSPILVYKPQGKQVIIGDKGLNYTKHSDNLFLVGFQTKEQLEVMKEGCKTVLCVDSTYSTTEYGFYLINLVVPDDYGQGYPVAHFITNHQDEETMKYIFQSIKTRCPDLEVNVLMTDDDQCEWKAFVSVFPGTKHILCIWHIRRNWNINMKSIGDSKLKMDVFHSLAVLMYEKHEPTFKALLEGFISKISTECHDFYTYFKNGYIDRTNVWALCYRNFPHGNTDTNMYCESLHNKLKTYYMERKQNRRVDDLIQILLRMEKDYYFKLWNNRIANKTKVKVPVMQTETHKRGMNISDSHITKHKENFWVIKSQAENSDEEYFVLKHYAECPMDHCFRYCVNQACKGLCEHLYSCTCPQPGGMCKHIHKIHSVVLRDTPATKDTFDEVWGQVDDQNLHLTVPAEVEIKTKEDVERKLVEECETLCNILQNRVSQPENSKFLQHIRNQLKQLEVMTSNTHKQTIEIVDTDNKFNQTMNVTGLQRIVPQKDLKFKRTAKKPAPKKNVLKNPNNDEKKEVKRSLLSLKGRADLKRKRNQFIPDETENNELVRLPTEEQPPQKIIRLAELVPQPIKKETTNSVPKLQSAPEPFKDTVPVANPFKSAPEPIKGSAPVADPKLVLSNITNKSVNTSQGNSFTPKLGYAQNIYQPILFFHERDSISFRNLKTLDPYLTEAECKSLSAPKTRFIRGWLHEDVIDAFLYHLCKDNNKVHSFPCFFVNFLNTPGEIRTTALNQLENKKLDSVETILLPSNVSNNHWVLLVLKPQLREIHIYDPMHTSLSEDYKDFLPKLTPLLNDRFKNTSKIWSVKCPPHSKQEGSVNCGAFVCFYARTLVLGKQTKPAQRVDMNKFREHIYQVIAGNCLKSRNYSTRTCATCQLKISTPYVTCINCHQRHHLSCIPANSQAISQFKCL